MTWEHRLDIPNCAQNVLTASRCVPKYQNNMSEFGAVLETMNGINRMRWERKPNYLVTHAHNKTQRRETRDGGEQLPLHIYTSSEERESIINSVH